MQVDRAYCKGMSYQDKEQVALDDDKAEKGPARKKNKGDAFFLE